MSLYDEVPRLQVKENESIPLGEVQGAGNAYDFVPPEQNDVASVNSEQNEDVFADNDEAWEVDEVDEICGANSVDIVDAPAVVSIPEKNGW